MKDSQSKEKETLNASDFATICKMLKGTNDYVALKKNVCDKLCTPRTFQNWEFGHCSPTQTYVRASLVKIVNTTLALKTTEHTLFPSI